MAGAMAEGRLSGARRVEAIAGVAAGGLGLLVVLVALSTAGVSGFRPAAFVFLLALALTLNAVVAGAWLDARHGWAEGKLILWTGTALLALAAGITAASFGLFLLPALLLALLASGAARWR